MPKYPYLVLRRGRQVGGRGVRSKNSFRFVRSSMYVTHDTGKHIANTVDPSVFQLYEKYCTWYSSDPKCFWKPIVTRSFSNFDFSSYYLVIKDAFRTRNTDYGFIFRCFFGCEIRLLLAGKSIFRVKGLHSRGLNLDTGRIDPGKRPCLSPISWKLDTTKLILSVQPTGTSRHAANCTTYTISYSTLPKKIRTVSSSSLFNILLWWNWFAASLIVEAEMVTRYYQYLKVAVTRSPLWWLYLVGCCMYQVRKTVLPVVPISNVTRSTPGTFLCLFSGFFVVLQILVFLF